MASDSIAASPGGDVAGRVASASRLVLITLMSAQFLMTLDSSVMNVSIAKVSQDIGTTVTGIQTAITLYTLVMASLMITGGKIGQIIGRKRAFAIGCATARLVALRTSLAVLAVIALIALFTTGGIRVSRTQKEADVGAVF